MSTCPWHPNTKSNLTTLPEECGYNQAPSMAEAIIFDLGDTLIDFEPMDMRRFPDRRRRERMSFLSCRGYRLPPFQVYCKRQFRAVKMGLFLCQAPPTRVQ